MEFKDYYKILGVEPNADEKAIKTAYRKLARLYHPDVSKLPDAEEKFKALAEAYEVLHNTEKRAEYDELRLARSRGFDPRNNQPGAGFNSSAGFNSNAGFNGADADQDFSDFFNSIFGSENARSHQSRNQQARHENPAAHRGRDLEMEWPVMLEDTLADTTKLVEFVIPHYDSQGQLHETKKSLNVKIPAGVNDGERIRLKGQGAPAQGVGTHGDLYLHIRLIPHPLFDLEGHNLILTLPLAPWEAALGAKITLPTLSGKISLTIAPNSQSGQRLRVRGKGLVTKNGIGDLFAVLKIVMPTTATEDAKKLWSQLAATASFDPRAEWSN
ncbi:MAG TPA: DnaJ C-terminal domain-containing protein [Cellvibrio sp.]|nr:DnaJ C-terminal domain-containing protein [Cellvibrio sp.]